jgi:hypothetical protein
MKGEVERVKCIREKIKAISVRKKILTYCGGRIIIFSLFGGIQTDI